jgi:hypothetical protein
MEYQNKKGFSKKRVYRMNEKSSEVKDNHKKSIQGIVTARKCDCCGHHEMGITSQTGKYIAFKPGMLVKIIGENSE